MDQHLNLPQADLKIKNAQVWDPLRKKYVPLTPEEWVRQHMIFYLTKHLGYPEGRMTSEYTVNYNGMKKRCDILFFTQDLKPNLVVECKAPDQKINENTFYQIARYASALKAKILILTNGIDHYCAEINLEKNALIYLEKIPEYVTD